MVHTAVLVFLLYLALSTLILVQFLRVPVSKSRSDALNCGSSLMVRLSSIITLPWHRFAADAVRVRSEWLFGGTVH